MALIWIQPEAVMLPRATGVGHVEWVPRPVGALGASEDAIQRCTADGTDRGLCITVIDMNVENARINHGTAKTQAANARFFAREVRDLRDQVDTLLSTKDCAGARALFTQVEEKTEIVERHAASIRGDKKAMAGWVRDSFRDAEAVSMQSTVNTLEAEITQLAKNETRATEELKVKVDACSKATVPKPPTCGADEKLEGGRCVKIDCGPGQVLNTTTKQCEPVPVAPAPAAAKKSNVGIFLLAAAAAAAIFFGVG